MHSQLRLSSDPADKAAYLFKIAHFEFIHAIPPALKLSSSTCIFNVSSKVVLNTKFCDATLYAGQYGIQFTP